MDHGYSGVGGDSYITWTHEPEVPPWLCQALGKLFYTRLIFFISQKRMVPTLKPFSGLNDKIYMKSYKVVPLLLYCCFQHPTVTYTCLLNKIIVDLYL